jgi:hypothetical protein
MRIILLILLTASILTACNKDKPDQPSIEGKWTGVELIVLEYESGILTDTDTTSLAGTTLDFQSNGSLVVNDPATGVETLPYSLQSPSKIIIDGDLSEIRDLTQTTVTLYLREEYGSDHYGEVFMRLRR